VKLYRERQGAGSPLLLLHATLSSSRQLRGLATRLARGYTVVTVDRRGSAASMVEGPAEPIDVAVHVADLVAVMAEEGLDRPLVVGHSYGGCVALELAAREPGLVRAVFAYEPPYGPAAPPARAAAMAEIGRRTLEARDQHGLGAAALAFMAAVSGHEAVAALSETARARVERAGQGAVADATLNGMDIDGLSRITCPVRIATGDASPGLYEAIAAGLVERIATADHVRLAGLDHMAPILRPESVADAIEAWR
jgi:pimeloyl-ACP methyl ester carboxylesterase